jgi:hypothetical protein
MTSFFLGQTAVHLSTIGDLDNQSINLTRSFSSFTSVDEAKLEEDVDLDCNTGRENYLINKHPTPMTRKAMETNKPWSKR